MRVASDPWGAGRRRSLELYLRALWGSAYEIRAGGAEQLRAAFVGRQQRLPGGTGTERTAMLDWARAAHAAAHAEFSGEGFVTGGLKPISRVLVSLFEDARVEMQARRRYPGLRALWAAYHVSSPADGDSLPPLLARLARALFDERYVDPDGWVQRAQAAFYANPRGWTDPESSRALGSRFGNDLGQMRRPFDERSYVVEPSYRDDHSGLWLTEAERRGERTQPSEDGTGATLVLAAGAEFESARIEAAQAQPEWDYVIGRLRDGFCRVIQTERTDGPAVDSRPRPHAALGRGLLRALSGVQRTTERQRRAFVGAELDFDALVRLQVERARGGAGDGRIYVARRPRRAKMSVLVLLDLSSSLTGAGAFDIEPLSRLRALLNALPPATPWLELGVDGFASEGRSRVDYRILSAFGEPGRLAAARLAERPAPGSTRLGAAVRHASQRLAARRSPRRLLLVVTDAELADIDVFDDRYLVEDARHAVRAARGRRIAVFGLVLAAGAAARPERIFAEHGRRGFARLGARHGLARGLRYAD